MNELTGNLVNLILVVKEGRGMPHTLFPYTITANFNNRVLNSEPVLMREGQPGPQFHSQVSWMMTKKELRRLRSSNTRVRVEVHIHDEYLGDNCLGFILLNPKTAPIIPKHSDKETSLNWHKLLSVPYPYRSNNPEVSLTLVIRDVEIGILNEPNLFAEGPDEESLSNLPINYLPDGYIKVGDCGDNPDLFFLSIVVQVACNLDLLLPEVLVFSQHLEKYYISFSMFGITVKTKPFSRDLHNSFAMSEKIVLRLRSTYECMQDFFAKQCQIIVYFYCGEDKLGVTRLSINHLLKDIAHDEFDQEHNCVVSMEEKCIFKLPSQHGMVPTGIDNRQPYIEVEMILRQTESKRKGFSQSTECPAKSISSDETIEEETTSEQSKTHIGDDFIEQTVETQPPSSTPSSPRDYGDHSHFQVETETSDETSGKSSSEHDKISEHAESEKTLSPRDDDECPPMVNTSSTEWKVSDSIQQRLEEISKPTNISYQQYCLAVIIEKVSWKKPMSAGKYFFRFKHPKATTELNVPSDIDSTSIDEDFLLENVKMKLFLISSSEQIRKSIYSWPPKMCLLDNKMIPITEQVDIFTSMLLCKDRREFFFSIELKAIRSFESLAKLKISMYLQEYELKDLPQLTGEELLPPVLDEKIALIELQELERWKDSQKMNFLTDLQILEGKHIKKLEEEWLLRKKELEDRLCKGVNRCQTLAQELQLATNTIKTCKALEKKECESLSQNTENKYNALNHEDLIRLIEKMENENRGLKEIINDLRKEIQQMKKTALTKEQTTNLLQELRGLEEKFEDAKKSKTYFKEQWKKAVREVHQLKADDHKQIQQNIHRNKEELSQYSLDKFFADGSGDEVYSLGDLDKFGLSKMSFNFKGNY